MLTPKEVATHGFPRAKVGQKGYSTKEVDDFLDLVTESYTTLYQENTTLKGKLKSLADKLVDYQATESAMRATLHTAQKIADEISEKAKVQSAELVEKAESKRQELLSRAQAESTAILQHTEERRLKVIEETRAYVDGQKSELGLELARKSYQLEQGQAALKQMIEYAQNVLQQQTEFWNSLPDLPLPESGEDLPREAVFQGTPAGDATVLSDLEAEALSITSRAEEFSQAIDKDLREVLELLGERLGEFDQDGEQESPTPEDLLAAISDELAAQPLDDLEGPEETEQPENNAPAEG